MRIDWEIAYNCNAGFLAMALLNSAGSVREEGRFFPILAKRVERLRK